MPLGLRHAPAQRRRNFSHDVRDGFERVQRHVCPARVHEDESSARARGLVASDESKRRAEIRLTISAPAARAARATSAFVVSTETGIVIVSAKAAMTGTTRRISSAAVTVAPPGRVDSPPTSMMSAPSATIARACSTARRASKNCPPSLKLSGVTLRMPMTSVRPPPYGSDRRDSFQRRVSNARGRGLARAVKKRKKSSTPVRAEVTTRGPFARSQAAVSLPTRKAEPNEL